MPSRRGVARRMPSSSAPFPPPTSTIVRKGVKSYAAATATAVIFVKSAMAASKLAACAGSFAISAKGSVAPRLRYAGSPVRTHHSSSFHESWIPMPAKRRTIARELPGRSARRHSPSAVSAKRPSSRSSKTPTLARNRSTRRSDGACVSVASASSSARRAPSFSRSATPSFAAR